MKALKEFQLNKDDQATSNQELNMMELESFDNSDGPIKRTMDSTSERI